MPAGETVATCDACNENAQKIASFDSSNNYKVAGSCHSTLLSFCLFLFLFLACLSSTATFDLLGVGTVVVRRRHQCY